MLSSSAGDDAACAPSPPSSSWASSKGKAMMMEEAEEGVPCGICLTDSRQAIRGELDCCAHHFCFVCIMAWARVESRCPFCKARFHTIRRPPVPGRLPSERIVAVAKRLQVFHQTLGNESSLVGADPSANSGCSVCNCTNDEDLLLLCELCAHVRTTVPEGDWFFNDCATSKEEHSRCEIDDGGPSDQGELEITIEVPSAEPGADPFRFGVVDEGYSLSSVRGRNAPSSGPIPVPSTNTDEYYRTNLVRATSAWSSGPFQVPSIYDDMDEDYGTSPVHVANGQSSGPVPSIYDIVDDDYATTLVRRTNAWSARPAEDLPSQSTSSDGSPCHESTQGRKRGRVFLHAHARFGMERARTLRNSRNLSNLIMELRENWSALRAGSVGFTTHNNRRGNGTRTSSAITEDQRCATSMLIRSKNGATTSSVNEHRQSTTASTKETTTISGHANRISPKETCHVNKAWKMLEMAKSAGARKKFNKPSPLDCTPRFSMGNRSTSFSPIDTILGQKNQSLSTEVA